MDNGKINPITEKEMDEFENAVNNGEEILTEEVIGGFLDEMLKEDEAELNEIADAVHKAVLAENGLSE